MTANVSLYDLIEIVGNELRLGFGASSTFIAIYNQIQHDGVPILCD